VWHRASKIISHQIALVRLSELACFTTAAGGAGEERRLAAGDPGSIFWMRALLLPL
jgi:hypothetical protein